MFKKRQYYIVGVDMVIIINIFKIHLKIIYFFLKFLKTDNHKIVFMSRQYNDVSIDYQLLYDDIKKRYNKYKIVMLNKKLEKNNIISYYFHIYKQMYYLATSKVCLVDTYIIPVSILNHKKDITIIQLCHGIGNIKKFGYQSLHKESGKNEKISLLMDMHKNYDYLISTSDETSKFYSEAFNMDKSKMLNFGPPKIDYLLKISSKKDLILKKYPKLKNKKNVLYVVTFRTYRFDFLTEFIEKFPYEEFNLILNVHPVMYKHYPDIEYKINDKRIFRCKEFITTDLLSICDIAITDYSSFAFESAILNIPTFFYLPDYKKYQEYNGLNVNLFKEMPGCVFEKYDDLFETIKKDKYDYTMLKKFKNKYIENCDGTSTQKLSDFMIKKCKK